MKVFGYLLSLLCAVLAIEIIVNGWSSLKYTTHLEAKDFIAFVQLLITFISAVLLASFNFATTRSNEQMKARLSAEGAAALARLQADLAVETAQAVEKIRAEFNRSVSESTERLRAELTRSSEDFKARLGQTIPQKYNGYHSMFKAATKYFFAIRRLEEGIYPEADLQAASAASDDAIGSALIVDKEDRDLFFSFVTEANFIAEAAKKEQEAEGLILLWEKEGRQFGRKYNNLEEAFSAKVQA